MATAGFKDLTDANPTLTMFLHLNVHSTFPMQFYTKKMELGVTVVGLKKSLFMSVFVSCYPTKLMCKHQVDFLGA